MFFIKQITVKEKYIVLEHFNRTLFVHDRHGYSLPLEQATVTTPSKRYYLREVVFAEAPF